MPSPRQTRKATLALLLASFFSAVKTNSLDASYNPFQGVAGEWIAATDSFVSESMTSGE